MANIPVNANDRVITVVATSDGQTDFDFDFVAFTGDQISARHVRLSDGVQTDLAFPSDFSASGLMDPNGGTITLIGTTIVVGDKIIIFGDTAIQRLADFQQSGDFLADTVNTEADLQTMMMQEIQRDIDRSVKFEVGNSNQTELLSSTSRLIGVDDVGNIAFYPISPVFTADGVVLYDNLSSLFASDESSRGVGNIWTGDRIPFPEVADSDPTPHATLAGGVKLGKPLRNYREFPHVFDYIPPAYHAAIQAGTSTQDVSGYIQQADDDVATGAVELRFPSGEFILGSEVVKDPRTAWQGARASRSVGGLGSMFVGEHNGNLIKVVGDSVNRHGVIAGIRLLNSDSVAYPLAKGILCTGDVRDHLFEEMYIGNFDINMDFDGGKAVDIRDIYSFGALTYGCHVRNGATDFSFSISQFQGGTYGLFLDGSATRLASMDVDNCRPQVSGTANLYADGITYLTIKGGYSDTAVSTGGSGTVIKNSSKVIMSDAQLYANGNGQPHLFLDAEAGEVLTDVKIGGSVFHKGGSTGTVTGIKFGPSAGTTRGVSITGNMLRDVTQSIEFETLTGTRDTITIAGGNVLNSTTKIVGASNVQSQLRVADSEGLDLYESYYLNTTDVVLDAVSAPFQRFSGTMNTSFNVDLPTLGNYVGKKFRIYRHDGGTGAITVRYNGATTVATLSNAGDYIDVINLGTGPTFVKGGGNV